MNPHNQRKRVFHLHVQEKDACCTSGHEHRHRPSPASSAADDHHHGHHAHAHADACCSPGEASGSTPARHDPPPTGTSQVRYRIDKMDCPTEERLIRNRLETMPGIVRLDFRLLDRELTVHHRLADAQPIAIALQALDMAPRLLEAGAPVAPVPPVLSTRLKILLTLSGLAAVAAEVSTWTGGEESSWLVVALAVMSILSAGLPILKKGWIALRNLTLNIYFLMSLAVVGAVSIGKWPEAAMVVFLFAVAEAIEALSLERARRAIRSLTALAPDTAEVRVADGWQEQAVARVAIGSRIRIRTGARVPLDARVESGRAALDQAPITGESLPVDKQVGDVLYAGSIVTDGVLEATVTAVAGDSTLARIAAAIQEAQAQRAPTQRFVDRFAQVYTPAVVALAVLLAVLGPVLFAGTWGEWLYQALVLLVIACPCALVVSTPITVVSGLAAAARHGILIKGGAHLEGGRLLKAVALDKTGTLTQGKPALTDAAPFGDLPLAEALLIAASLDEHSTHPVAQSAGSGMAKAATRRDDAAGRGLRGAQWPWRQGPHRWSSMASGESSPGRGTGRLLAGARGTPGPPGKHRQDHRDPLRTLRTGGRFRCRRHAAAREPCRCASTPGAARRGGDADRRQPGHRKSHRRSAWHPGGTRQPDARG
jgi:Cd2+/Zn2+-exporting ATPase